MNNYDAIRNFELNEARKKMNMTNLTSMSNNVNSSMNQGASSSLPNLYNSTSIDSNEINKAKQKMNSYSSMDSSNNSMY